jgi:hypothetical protein
MQFSQVHRVWNVKLFVSSGMGGPLLGNPLHVSSLNGFHALPFTVVTSVFLFFPGLQAHGHVITGEESIRKDREVLSEPQQ